MDPQNRWVKMADSIPWSQFEESYSLLFEGTNGNVAKPLRLALGSLIIQTKYQFADKELVEQLTENPYYQYFIGLPGYQQEAPIDASPLVLFRKRLTIDIIMEANNISFRPRQNVRTKQKTRMILIKCHPLPVVEMQMHLASNPLKIKERSYWMQPMHRQISGIHRIFRC